MQSLDPRVVTLWRLRALISLGTFWLPVTLAGGAFVAFQVGLLPAVAMGTAWIAILLLYSLGWPGLAYRYFHYEVGERELLVEQGVFFRQAVAVPLHRIQHVDSTQGPVERFVGLASLRVSTAAGLSADASIPGLDEAEATRLRKLLAQQAGDDGV
jgi:membrane protein YdbS with pleckstrin-like domain